MIDFAAIAAAFQAGFAAQTHHWPVLFDSLEKLVEKLDEQARVAELTTRGYPVLRYRNDAVGVRLALGPAPLLVDPEQPARSFGASLSAGVRDFTAGLGQAGEMVHAEQALPHLISDTAAMLAAVDASLRRFERATPAMFEGNRRFSDAFGLAGLAFRSLQGQQNRNQLRRAAAQAGYAFGWLRSLGGPQTGPQSGPQTESGQINGQVNVVDQLEQASAGVLDALLVLPIAGLALDVALTEAVLAAETAILDEFSTLERSVYQIRSGVVNGWLTAFEAGSTVAVYTAAADLVVRVNDSMLSSIFPSWLDDLLDGVQMFAYGISLWGSWAYEVAVAFQVATDDLMGVDLMPWIVRNALSEWIADHIPLPTLTLGGLVALISGDTVGGLLLRKELDDFFDAVDDALWAADFVFDVKDLRQKAADLAGILHVTLTPTPFLYPPDVPPSGPLAGFPDVYQDLFGGTRRADLLAAVRNTGDTLRDSVHSWLGAGATLSAGLAGTARAELERQARYGTGVELGRRFDASGPLVQGLFGPLRADLEQRTGSEPADPLAEAFDGAVATTGVAAAAAAIPVYAGQLARFWTARSASRQYPTSAHLLARRGKLAAVRVPRLALRAPGRTPGQPLAAESADAFRGAVLAAYRDGRDQLALLAGGAGSG